MIRNATGYLLWIAKSSSNHTPSSLFSSVLNVHDPHFGHLKRKTKMCDLAFEYGLFGSIENVVLVKSVIDIRTRKSPTRKRRTFSTLFAFGEFNCVAVLFG